jgi:hypothetical protein
MLTISQRALASAIVLTGLAACGGTAPTPAPTTTPSPATVVAPAVTQPSPPPASAEPAGPAISLPKGPKPRTDRQLLTRDVILETQYTNMYDVILALRGSWLRSRGAESIQGKSATVQIYLDNQRLNGAEELRSIAPTNIETVRYYDPIQASARWGMDHGAGAIYILTAKR